MYTLEEQERAAYQAGDITLAGALAARIDMQHALAFSRALHSAGYDKLIRAAV